jgi:lysophospholipid acyltransferase (LPLAT)-like uncharacterized protein
MSKLLPHIVYWFYRAMFASWRIQYSEHPAAAQLISNRKPVLLAHWHGDELAIIHLVKKLKLATMTSTSKDGSLVDYVIHRLGGHTSRGSSTRGAVTALKGLVRLCREGHPTSMAVDGPKGPLRQVKPGVFELSRLCEAPIVPVGVFAPNAFVFKKSWNKAILPLPFSRVIIYFGDPLNALTRADDPKSSTLALTLGRAIDDASSYAGKTIAAP